MHRIHDNTKPDPQAILVVLPTWVGDFVMATPALRAVRNRFPESRITFLAEPNLRDLIEGGDWRDEVVVSFSRYVGRGCEIPTVSRGSLWAPRHRRQISTNDRN